MQARLAATAQIQISLLYEPEKLKPARNALFIATKMLFYAPIRHYLRKQNSRRRQHHSQESAAATLSRLLFDV